MSKIVIDARIIKSTTGRYVERLLSHLQKIDSDNEYLVLVRPSDRGFWKPTASNLKLVEAPFADFSVSEQLGLNKLLRKLKPDLVHFPVPQHPLLYRGKFISTIHDLTMLDFTHRKWYELWYQCKSIVFAHVFRHAARRAEHIIVPTKYVQRQLVERMAVWPENITVTYEATDTLAARPKAYALPPKAKFLLYVGQPTPYKNLERLLEAFSQLSPTYPDLYLVLAGKKNRFYQQLESLVKKQNIPRVIFADFVPDEQLAWLYANAEMCVAPSLSEGFGLPGLEAMANGCPVVAAGNSCMPEVYGDAALYFDPYVPEDIANIINRVLSDDTERRRLAAAGKKKASEYSWQRMAEQTLEVYRKSL